MPLKAIQEEVDKWVNQYKIGYFKPLEIMACLTEEVGELAREVNHQFGPKKKKASENSREMADEIADIIFTLSCLSNSLKLDIDAAFKRVMDKCYGRDMERWEKK